MRARHHSIVPALALLLLAPTVQAEAPRTDDYGDPLPPGAVARLGTVRLRYVSGAACLAFSPNGKTLVSASDDGLRAWEVASGKDLGWFQKPAPATSVHFAPDGKTLLTLDNKGSIRLWEAGTGKLLRETIPAPDNKRFFQGLNSFLSADGKVAGVTGQVGDGVRLWETETCRRIMARQEPGRSLFFSAALSPDGKTLVVSGAGNRAHLLEVPTGKELRVIEGPNKTSQLPPGFPRLREQSVYWFTFSPDGKTLAGVSGKESFSVWNVADGTLRYTVKGCRGRLAFSPDGKQLVCGGDKEMRLYESATGKELRQFERHGGFVYALAFSPDVNTLATASGYTLDLWDVATGKRRFPLGGHESPVCTLAFAPDGSSLASGDQEQGLLIVWSLKDHKPRHTLTGHYPGVLSLAYSPDGKVLASGDGYRGSGGLDAQIRLWDPSAGRLIRQFPGHLNGVDRLVFSPDSKTLASGGYDSRLRLWAVATVQRLWQVRGEGHMVPLWPAFLPDGKTLLISDSRGGFALRRLDSRQRAADFDATPLGNFKDPNRSILFTSLLPDGRTVLTVESRQRIPNSQILLWDAESGRLLRSLSIGRLEGNWIPFAVSPDGNTLATGGRSNDPSIRLWDTTTGKLVGLFAGNKGGTITALAFSADGKTLASGGRDTTVLLWDVGRSRLEYLWAGLTGASDDDGPRAAKRLAAIPEDSIPFLKDRLQRAAATEEKARRHITDLDDDNFDVREKATLALEALGPDAVLPLRLALRGSPSAEVCTRLKAVLDKLKIPQAEQGVNPESVALALAVLEQIGTPPARQALEELAKGPEQSTVTREAKAALGRLAKRPKRTPKE